jgi:hypothetical protein
MLRKIYISALQPDAGRRLMWITPGATRGMETTPHCRELRSSSTRYGVVGDRLLRHPGLHPGLSTLDAFRRQPAAHKKSCVT